MEILPKKICLIRAMESVIFSLLRNRPCCKKRICTEAITAV